MNVEMAPITAALPHAQLTAIIAMALFRVTMKRHNPPPPRQETARLLFASRQVINRQKAWITIMFICQLGYRSPIPFIMAWKRFLRLSPSVRCW